MTLVDHTTITTDQFLTLDDDQRVPLDEDCE